MLGEIMIAQHTLLLLFLFFSSKIKAHYFLSVHVTVAIFVILDYLDGLCLTVVDSGTTKIYFLLLMNICGKCGVLFFVVVVF